MCRRRTTGTIELELEPLLGKGTVTGEDGGGGGGGGAVTDDGGGMGIDDGVERIDDEERGVDE